MLPKLKAGPNLTQKRKTHLANEPAKRAKTSDSSATPTPLQKSASATDPAGGIPKKAIINLTAKATSLPDEAYFHPTAIKLFDQITTIEGFRQAAKVFWISSSANVRAVSDEKSNQILAKLSHNKTPKWHESSQYTTIWNEQRLAVVNHFIEKVRYYTEEFLQTEGGIRFKEAADKSRRRKIALPVLDSNTLCNFEGATGLSWSYTTVFDIFALLDDIHEGENQIEVEAESGLVKENWFSSDSLKKPGSWYERLSRVASSLVIQWTLILCGFSRPGGQVVEATDKSLILLLEHIPTSPISNKYPPFPIADMHLHEWLAIDANEEGSLEEYPSQRSQIARDWTMEVSKVESGVDELDPRKIEKAMERGPPSKRSIDLDTIKDLTGLVDPLEPVSNIWPRAPSYPPAPVSYPPLTITDYAFVLGTTRQKMHIVQALADQQINAMTSMIHLLNDEIQVWQKDLDMLVEQDQLLGNLILTGRTHAASLKDIAKKTYALTTRIEDQKLANPSIIRALNLKQKSQQHSSPVLPSQAQSRFMDTQPPAKHRSVTPHESPNPCV